MPRSRWSARFSSQATVDGKTILALMLAPRHRQGLDDAVTSLPTKSQPVLYDTSGSPLCANGQLGDLACPRIANYIVPGSSGRRSERQMRQSC